MTSMPIMEESKTTKMTAATNIALDEDNLIIESSTDTLARKVWYRPKELKLRHKFWYGWLLSLILQAVIVTYYFVSCRNSKNPNYFANVWLIIALLAALMNIFHYLTLAYQKNILQKLGWAEKNPEVVLREYFPSETTNEEITEAII
jgi:hypothetical protein